LLVELPAIITRPTDQGHRIEHGHGQGTDYNHDQGNSTGPPLLVELATGLSTTQAKVPTAITTKATTPARLRW
jgi:hypothetical protein